MSFASPQADSVTLRRMPPGLTLRRTVRGSPE